MPEVDFSTSCVVFTYIERPSISDQILGVELLEEDSRLKFVVTIDECESCWAAVGQFYPYGVYKFSYNEESITLQTKIL